MIAPLEKYTTMSVLALINDEKAIALRQGPAGYSLVQPTACTMWRPPFSRGRKYYRAL